MVDGEHIVDAAWAKQKKTIFIAFWLVRLEFDIDWGIGIHLNDDRVNLPGILPPISL